MATKKNLRSTHKRHISKKRCITKKRHISKKRLITKKRRITKKRLINRRTKKYLKKNMSKKRRIYSKKIYQKGGLFNDDESAKLKESLKRIGFTEDNEIDNILTGMQKMSQQHTTPETFGELLDQMSTFHDKEEFKQWLGNIEPMFEDKVETDVEDDSDYSDNSDDSDDSDDEE
jgi:hypothetical protein